MEGRLRRKMIRLVNDFDNASANLAMKGRMHPDSWYEVESRHSMARLALIQFIEEMYQLDLMRNLEEEE